MKRPILVETGFLPKTGKQTREAVFLAEMETFLPWPRLDMLIEPFYMKKRNDRSPISLSTMLRTHFLQQWFGYPDLAMEEALHDNRRLCRFAGLDVFEDVMPDESTILRLRHLLEEYELATAITMLDARQSSEGTLTLCDEGYHKANPTIERFEKEDDRSVITTTKKVAGGKLSDKHKSFNRMLSAVRAIVEQTFLLVKHQFEFVKVIYRGIKKNAEQIMTLFALTNLSPVRKQLLLLVGGVRL